MSERPVGGEVVLMHVALHQEHDTFAVIGDKVPQQLEVDELIERIRQ